MIRLKILCGCLFVAAGLLAFVPPGMAAPARIVLAMAETKILLDINTASKSDLMILEGVGDKRADAIIEGRPYKGKDDLVARRILPQSVYDAIKDKIIAKQK